MTFGHAERRKECDNQLNNVAWEANASSSSSSWFRLVLTKSVKPSTDLEQPEGLFPKMGACGRRNKIDRSLELEDLKNCCRRRRRHNDALVWLLLWWALIESHVALPAWLGGEVQVDLFFLQLSDEQTAWRCVCFWRYRRCNGTSRGQFFTRNDCGALVASLRPLPNVTHASACKILAGTGPKPPKMVVGPNLSCNSFGRLSLSCFSVFAPVASAKNKGVAGNWLKFLLDPFYSQHSQFCSISTKSMQKWHFHRLRCLILG